MYSSSIQVNFPLVFPVKRAPSPLFPLDLWKEIP